MPRPKRKPPDAEQLAALCLEARTLLSRAGRALHDDAGPLLTAAGLRLQLLGKDHPAAAEQVQEISEILNQAMERIRTVSRDLNPSPVYRGGLKNALARLAEDVNRSSKAEVRLDYAATAAVGLPAAEALYDAAYAAIGQAVRGGGAARVHIRVTGAKGLTLRIADDGRSKGRAAALWVARLLARGAGLSFEIATGKSTIVSIKYALRRPTRG